MHAYMCSTLVTTCTLSISSRSQVSRFHSLKIEIIVDGTDYLTSTTCCMMT